MKNLAIICVFFAACDAPPTYHQDIAPILQGRCVSCHQEGGIGPFALDTFDLAKSMAPVLVESVVSKRMPPWGAAEGHRQYLDNPSLSAEQIEAIRLWADSGAPEGDADRPGEALVTVSGGLSRSDLTLTMPEAYTPQQFPDDYRCFVLDWPEQGLTHVTGFAAQPGNRQTVHHIAMFLVGPDTPLGDGAFEKLAEFDAHDDGPGYRCFGGPSGHEDLGIPIQQLAQWVPGSSGWDFPAGTGIPVKPGSKLVLQLHYNSASVNPAPDQTSVSLRLDTEVARRAAFAPWLDIGWVMGSMQIPAGEADVLHSVQDDPRSFFEFLVGDLDLSSGFRIHSVLLHMHQRGHAGEVAVHRQGGGEEVLLEEARYDFNWQQIYRFKEPVEFAAGDEISLICRWDNSAGNQAPGQQPADIAWGEGTAEEMCVANLYISENPQ
jgi:hypothetical protein